MPAFYNNRKYASQISGAISRQLQNAMKIDISQEDHFLQNKTLLLKITALILLSVSIIFRIRSIFIRYFEADELEHLRGAFCVFNNWLPYKDFFEHHTPLLYYLLSPIYYLGDNLNIIFVGRLIMLSFSIMIILLVFQVARGCFGSIIAWLSTIWLSYIFMFFEKTMEIRPDVPALAFFLSGLFLLIRLPHNQIKLRGFSAGIFFSLAFLSTQKIVFPIIGIFLFWTVKLIANYRTQNHRKRCIQIIYFILLGLSIPFSLTLIYFYYQGGLSDFIYRNFLMNLQWKRQLPFSFFLKTLIYENPFFIFWFIWGWIATGGQILIHRGNVKYALVWFSASMGILSLFILPVVLPQTYALQIPLFTILAGKGLFDFLEYLLKSEKTNRLFGSLLLFISGPGILWLTNVAFGYRPNLVWEDTLIVIPIYIFFGALVCLLFVFDKKKTMRIVSFSLLGLLVISRPIIFMINHDRIDNRGQIIEMETILRETNIQDRVFDTWPLGGFLRLPSYYYHFLHHGILQMMTPEEKDQKLLSALKTNRPKIIVKGINFSVLAPEVRDYININYQTRLDTPNLLIRK